jgi:hypothetical protein
MRKRQKGDGYINAREKCINVGVFWINVKEIGSSGVVE